MTNQQTEFVESIARQLRGVEHFNVGAATCCPECRSQFGLDDDADAELYDEGGFSWSACESCGTTLGGNRSAAHGWIDGQLYHFDVCDDCLCYHANGDLPTSWR